MHLYFLRHGHAVESSEWEGTEAERPLTEEGRFEMLAAARGLALLGPEVSAIATSPFARAHETARIVAEALEVPFTIWQDLVPGCTLARLAPLLAQQAGTDGLMLVGHEPDLSDCAGLLIGGADPARLDFKKGTCCRVDLPMRRLRAAEQGATPLHGAGTLEWLAPARHLAMLGA